MTMNEIVEELKLRGIRNRKGGEISVNVISNILKNRRYLGEYIFRDIVIPNGIPQIVPQELFGRVQERMAFNRKAPARHKAEEEYLLSTKLFCGKCQRMMAGESGTSRENIVYRYYKCSGVKRKLGCDKEKRTQNSDSQRRTCQAICNKRRNHLLVATLPHVRHQ